MWPGALAKPSRTVPGSYVTPLSERARKALMLDMPELCKADIAKPTSHRDGE